MLGGGRAEGGPLSPDFAFLFIWIFARCAVVDDWLICIQNRKESKAFRSSLVEINNKKHEKELFLWQQHSSSEISCITNPLPMLLLLLLESRGDC